MTLAVSMVGFGRFTITHLTRMVSSTLRSGGNAHSGRIFSIGSLPCIALPRLLPFAGLHLNPRKFSSDAFNTSSKPGLATPGLLVHQRLWFSYFFLLFLLFNQPVIFLYKPFQLMSSDYKLVLYVINNLRAASSI